MGSPSDEMCGDSYGPVHHVTIEEAFYIGRYEVTQKEWREVMGDNPSRFEGDDLPVEQVSGTMFRSSSGSSMRMGAQTDTACHSKLNGNMLPGRNHHKILIGDSESKLGDYAW